MSRNAYGLMKPLGHVNTKFEKIAMAADCSMEAARQKSFLEEDQLMSGEVK